MPLSPHKQVRSMAEHRVVGVKIHATNGGFHAGLLNHRTEYANQRT
jgi:hypothetical protein